jgi:hypothetical protein
MHKGFKCIHVSFGRIYISQDVIFDEFVFPFASLHSNVGARYTSDVLLISSGNNDDTNLTNDPTRSLFPADSTVPTFVHQPLPRIVVPDQVPGRLPPATVEIPTESVGPSDWMQVPVSSSASTDVGHASMQPQVLSPTMPTTPVLTRLTNMVVPPASTFVTPIASEQDLASDPALDVAPAHPCLCLLPWSLDLLQKLHPDLLQLLPWFKIWLLHALPYRQVYVNRRFFLWNSSLCLFY